MVGLRRVDDSAAASAAGAAVRLSNIPRQWSNFINTFTDFSVTGYVLGPDEDPGGHSSDRLNAKGEDGGVVSGADSFQWEHTQPIGQSSATVEASRGAESLGIPRATCDADGNAPYASISLREEKSSYRRDSSGGDGRASEIRTFYPATERIVAIGDVHGDLRKTREALRISRLIDEKDRWIGGKATLVQVGDVLDRGGQELAIFFLLEKLRREASRAGGQVHVLHGNHETGNIAVHPRPWFRYATSEGLREFDSWARWTRLGNSLKAKCKGAPVSPCDVLAGVPPEIHPSHKARYAALAPGGPLTTRLLADHPTVLVIGSSVFVHGGLLPCHVEYGLHRMNQEVKHWVTAGGRPRDAPSIDASQGLHGTNCGSKDGKSLGGKVEAGATAGTVAPSSKALAGSVPPPMPHFLRSDTAVVWARNFSEPAGGTCDCALLEESLRGVPGVQRMVVGHTIQPGGINSACGGKVYRVDVGMSAGCYNARPQTLEILNDKEVNVIKTDTSFWYSRM